MRYFSWISSLCNSHWVAGAPLAALLLSGCASTPQLGPRPSIRQPDTIATGRSLPEIETADWPDDSWWTRFGDPQLDALIAEGLQNSPDVAAALARFRNASAMAQVAGAAGLPTLDIEAEASADKQSYNNGFPKEFLPKGFRPNARLAANFGFDLDLWGRNRAALAAATSEARAIAIEGRQAQLMLTSGIADAYVDLGRLYEERDVRQAALDLRQATRKLVSDRMANGLENRGNLRQAEAQVATARSELAGAEQNLTLRRHQISALLGAGPDRGLEIGRPDLDRAGMIGLPPGVTTELVGRRPDIAAARARVEAEASRIAVAHADFFPAIRLNALIGLQSLGIGNLFESDSTVGSVGPALSLPIFRGGALQGRYRSARAGYDEAVADYDRVVLDAYRQVADAVTSRARVSERLADARSALDASQEAYHIARLRYEGGLSTYLDVLLVEDRLLQARVAVSGLDANARTQDIALVRALGGGFDDKGYDGFKDSDDG